MESTAQTIKVKVTQKSGGLLLVAVTFQDLFADLQNLVKNNLF